MFAQVFLSFCKAGLYTYPDDNEMVSNLVNLLRKNVQEGCGNGQFDVNK